MKVAVVHDDPGYVGGAELTMAEFAQAAPEEAEFVMPEEAEIVVLGNCVRVTPEDLDTFEGKRVVRYHHDLARRENPKVRAWLERHAEHIFTSPFHQDRYDSDDLWPNIPPPVDIAEIRALPEPPTREGTCSLASWRNPGKGGQLLREWSEKHGLVDVYGDGPFVPLGPKLEHKGALAPTLVPAALTTYERFVFLPSEPEPFGRCVVEAWAAGCKVTINGLVGSRYYIENAPADLESAGR